VTTPSNSPTANTKSGSVGAKSATAGGTNTRASAIATPKSLSKALTVGDVIEMHTAGVQNQQIVEVIRSSPVQFNLLDKETLVAIARAKLPLNLQNEMRKKAGLTPLAPTTQP
jgi:hypothetical protein